MNLAMPALALGLIGATIGYFVNSSVGWTTDSPAAGRWTCKARQDSAEIQTDSYFAKDGALRVTVWVRTREDGHSFAGKMKLEGQWGVRGDTLKADYKTSELISATTDGRQLPMGVLRPYFDRDFSSTAFHSIHALGEQEMTYEAALGRVKCER